jgi:protein-arginine kinase activator protein McsA
MIIDVCDNCEREAPIQTRRQIEDNDGFLTSRWLCENCQNEADQEFERDRYDHEIAVSRAEYLEDR